MKEKGVKAKANRHKCSTVKYYRYLKIFFVYLVLVIIGRVRASVVVFFAHAHAKHFLQNL